MSYQAVIRNAGDQLVTNQEIGVRVSILQNSINGIVIYQEIYNPNPETNNNGLLTIEIGAGVPLTGTFSEIDWSNGPYFLKTEIDPSGGTTYTITGTSQLLSVPYALYSGTAEILNGEITESQISDLQDYLTEETDPFFTGSPASGIEVDDIDNWKEAYEWGDHAAGGYITEVSSGNGLSGGGTSGAVTLSVDGTVVRTSGDQSIGGNKTFTGTTTVAEPVNSTDAVNKAYVDDILALFGISLHENYAGTVTDIDGNIYKTVTIGTQTWMAENLRTGRYNDGTIILYIANNSNWKDWTTPAYCWYNNEVTYVATFGALYNWYAIDPASNGGKNLCPIGWHVPSVTEWTALTDYLGGTSVAAGKLRETGTAHWRSSMAVATNETGFTALPGGQRHETGFFTGSGRGGYWWTNDINALHLGIES